MKREKMFVKKKSYFSKLYIGVIISLFLLAFTIASAEEKPIEEFLNKTYKYQDPIGDYLVGGGKEFFTIKKITWAESFTNTKDKVYFLLRKRQYSYADTIYEKSSIRVYPAGYDRSFMGATIEKGILKLYTEFERDEKSCLHFIPNDTIAGNWDLLKGSYSPEKCVRIPNFLCKITSNNERIKEYFINRNKPDENKPNSSAQNKLKNHKLLALALSVIKKEPQNLTLKTLYFDALILNKDFHTLEKELNKLKDVYDQTDDVLLSAIYSQCRKAILAEKLSKNGINGWDFLKKFTYDSIPWSQQVEGLIRINLPIESCRNFSSLIHPISVFTEAIRLGGNHAITESYWNMIIGERNRALNILSGIYKTANILFYSGDSTDLLIGSDIKLGCIEGVGIYLLNCCETNDEITSCSKRLNEMFEMEKNLENSRENIERDFAAEFYNIDNKWQFLKPITAKIETMRAAAVVKNYQIEKKSLPKSDEQFRKYFKDNFPRDPFSNGPLRYISEANKFTLYSVGPDNIDDNAAIYYDPTNGAISLGDIVTAIPLKREYPFPKEGLKANSKAEVEKIFPNGLPKDPFVIRIYPGYHFVPPNDLSKNLQILDTNPVKIYSIGPDLIQNFPISNITNSVGFDPGYTYDPTNGVDSSGDIIYEIPQKENKTDTNTQRK